MPEFPKFIVDECTGPAVAEWLIARGFETISIFEAFRGSKDIDILTMAIKTGGILITNDKDFGGMVFKERNVSFNGLSKKTISL